MTEQKRDNAYYIQRLNKWPSLSKAVKAGTMSVAEARRAAGLGGYRSRLHELKNAWSKTTPTERSDFLSWASLEASVTPLPSRGTSAWDADGRMLEWASKRIPDITHRRGLSLRDLADELGIQRSNQSVTMAIQNGSRVKDPKTAEAVNRWLDDNFSV